MLGEIWEVKYCGPAALGAQAQLDKYIPAVPNSKEGTSIEAAYFETTGPKGEGLWVMYWQTDPGVILYSWGKTLDEMQKDAMYALGGAAAIKLLFGINKYCSLVKGTLGALGSAAGYGFLPGAPQIRDPHIWNSYALR